MMMNGKSMENQKLIWQSLEENLFHAPMKIHVVQVREIATMTMLNAKKVLNVRSELTNKKERENHFMVLNSQEICFKMIVDLTISVIILIGPILDLNMKDNLYSHVINLENLLQNMKCILYLMG